MADRAQPQGCSFRASVPGETIASASGNAIETESERWLPVVGVAGAAAFLIRAVRAVRPAQKRLDDLDRALAAARSGLVEARAIENAGTRETAGALADAEQVGRGLAHELSTAASVEAAIEAHVRETERTLDVLRRSLVAEVAKRVVLTETAAATGERIVTLRAKVEAQRAKVAPLVRRRAHEVERLERRIALVAAHQAARAVIAPAKARTVLGFPQTAEVPHGQ